MRFKTLFIEKHLANSSRVQRILSLFPQAERRWIQRYEDIFGRVRKPYLEKRHNLNLFVAEKRGQLVKEAPPSYGRKGDPHYTFLHSYNCLYECEYCYLQGFFKSPDLVLFVNIEDIAQAIRDTVAQHPSAAKIWFHAGEYSDSLALAHLTDEWGHYFDVFSSLPSAHLELRTKSANVRPLLKLSPAPNITVSYSLSPAEQIQRYDRKTPSLQGRLSAMAKLEQQGFRLGLHFDPIIEHPHLEDKYRELMEQISGSLSFDSMDYLSLGVVRFTRDVFKSVKNHYPDSALLSENFAKSFDGKIRYPRPTRMHILQTVRKVALQAGFPPEKLYLCMEKDDGPPVDQETKLAATSPATESRHEARQEAR